MGCYNDSTLRAIPNQLPGNYSSVAQCQAAALAAGYNTCALQNGSQCFAGNNSPYSQYGQATGCPTLGGAWQNQVYQLTSVNTWSTQDSVEYTVSNSDLPNQPMNDTAANCELACLANPLCVGFSRPKSAADTAVANCYLKQALNAGPITHGDPTWYTYMVKRNPGQWQNWVEYTSATSDLAGQPMVGTFQACEAACAANASCAGFSWPKATAAGASAQCYLKANFNSPITQNDGTWETYIINH
jgi:hypothetical protein